MKKAILVFVFLAIALLIVFFGILILKGSKASDNSQGKVNNSYSVPAPAKNVTTLRNNGAKPYFSDGFENYTSGVAIPPGAGGNGFLWGNNNAGSVKVSPEYSHSGNKSLMLHFPGVADGVDDWTQESFYLAPNASASPQEVWIDYYLRIPNNFVLRNDTPNNNKLLAIWANQYNSENDTLVDAGYEGSASQIKPTVNEYPNNTGNHNVWEAPYLFTQEESGQWIHVQVHARVGSPGNNGTWEGWINGNLKWKMTNHSLYAPGGNNFWRQGYLMGWANSGFSSDTNFYIDDFKVYTQNPGWS